MPFVSSRLDYCNSLFSCQQNQVISCLMQVLNSGARLVTPTNTQKKGSYNSHSDDTSLASHTFLYHFKILVLTLGGM